jgi:hypothetical protein
VSGDDVAQWSLDAEFLPSVSRYVRDGGWSGRDVRAELPPLRGRVVSVSWLREPPVQHPVGSDEWLLAAAHHYNPVTGPSRCLPVRDLVALLVGIDVDWKAQHAFADVLLAAAAHPQTSGRDHAMLLEAALTHGWYAKQTSRDGPLRQRCLGYALVDAARVRGRGGALTDWAETTTVDVPLAVTVTLIAANPDPAPLSMFARILTSEVYRSNHVRLVRQTNEDAYDEQRLDKDESVYFASEASQLENIRRSGYLRGPQENPFLGLLDGSDLGGRASRRTTAPKDLSVRDRRLLALTLYTEKEIHRLLSDPDPVTAFIARFNPAGSSSWSPEIPASLVDDPGAAMLTSWMVLRAVQS